jgi:hypothetical protein
LFSLLLSCGYNCFLNFQHTFSSFSLFISWWLGFLVEKKRLWILCERDKVRFHVWWLLFSLQFNHVFISHKFCHPLCSYLGLQVALFCFGPSFLLFYTLAHLTFVIFFVDYLVLKPLHFILILYFYFCTLILCLFGFLF